MAEPYCHWLDLFVCHDQRVVPDGRTATSLTLLERQARLLRPTVVVVLGTGAGLALRALWRGAPDARLVAVDPSPAALRESLALLPLDFSRIALLEQDIPTVDFPALWGPGDRVLLFVDRGARPEAAVMGHVLESAVPALPMGSLVVVDGLWYSPEELSDVNAQAFLEELLGDGIDRLQCFEARFAPYHRGGSFLGLGAVEPLLEYVNAHGIELTAEGRTGSACFSVGPSRRVSGFDAAAFARRCARVGRNPLDGAVTGNFRVSATGKRIAALYQKAGPLAATELLIELARKEPSARGLAYALAVCQAQLGRPREAITLLDRELSHPRANALHGDLARTFLAHRDPKTGRRESGLTLFAMPKSFVGHVADIQRNAIQSWTRLRPRPEIILFGDEPGIAEIATEFGLRHIPEVARNDCSTPLVDALFATVQELSDKNILAYVNADIILFNDFPAAVDAVQKKLPEFLMVGRRFDYDQLGRLEFSDPGWAEDLRRRVREDGLLHAETGIDYFVFTPGLWPRIPPFALGRMAWDNWLVKTPQVLGKAVIDASDAVMIVHQTHDYNHMAGGRASLTASLEAQRNQLLCGPVDAGGFTCSATWALGADGFLAERPPQPSTFGSAQFKAERLAWLVRRTDRLIAANRLDLAKAHLEEGLGLSPGNAALLGLQGRIAAMEGHAASTEMRIL